MGNMLYLKNLNFTTTSTTLKLALEATAAASAAGPPPVSLATLMGPDFDAMFANIGAALRGGLLAPVQIIATR